MIRDKLKRMDYSLIIIPMVLAIFGIIMVYSASFPFAYVHYDNSTFFVQRQILWFLIGLVFFVFATLIPIHVYGRLSPIFVLLSIILLILVLLPGVGVERNNSQRWIQLGFFLFQPTEAIKIFMILYFAYIFARKQSYIEKFHKGLLPPLIILLVVFLLILSQPDLGTAALILLSCGIIVTCSGARWSHLLFLISTAVVGLIYFAYSSPYRLDRLTSFRNPFDNFAGDSYQLVNSLTAIGSGGLTGNGLGASIQKLGFLPESHTDFIMAITIEELGLLGLFIVIITYMFILVRGIQISRKLTESFHQFLAIGITFQLMIQIMFNLGAVSGLLPITGITLPLISYGGSSLLFTMISIGILVNLSSYAEEQTEEKI